MPLYKAQDIFDQTRGGLDVILTWCPEADQAHQRRNTHFKFNTDDTKPSCSLRLHGGLWWVKNFGEDWPAMHAIALVMRLENCTFGEACMLIGDRLQIKPDDPDVKAKPGFEYRAERPDADQHEGWYHIEYQAFTVEQLKTIFSLNVWNYLRKKDAKTKDEETEEQAVTNGSEVCKRYNFYSVAWYSWVSRSKKTNEMTRHVIRSTDSYPIFCIEEGNFKKLYQPKAKEPKDRFRYYGQKPERFVHGIARHTLQWEQENKVRASGTDEDTGEDTRDEWKHPALILCSGGSDALNVAALGHAVCWKNSETEPLTEAQYRHFRKLARHVYVLYDNDADGKEQTLKMTMQFLDMRGVYLPDFREDADRDWRGKRYKDVRDYFQKYRPDEFKNLLANAYPMRFWDEAMRIDRKGDPVMIDGEVMKKYSPAPTLIRNFLYRNGFARLVMGVDESGTKQWEYVRVVKNLVKRVTPDEIRQFLHGFLEDRCFDWRLRDAFSRSSDVGDAQITLLPEIDLEFVDFDSQTQFLFFKNKVWRITKAGIEEQDTSKADRFVWAHEVIGHAVKRAEAPFRIWRDEHDQIRVEIKDKSCLFLRYLINASRVHWRKEIEDAVAPLSPQEREEYLKKVEFCIDGDKLSAEEIQEQMQHLANKLTAFGYILHRHKSKAAAYAVWTMDYVMDGDESSGGTGKSMAASSLTQLMPVHSLNGRNEEEIKDRFKFEGVTRHTDLIWIDDAHKQTPFDEFFSMITNFMTINRKGQKIQRLEFRDSPKLYITSNFTPTKMDSSTWRRLWFTAYSDYYHFNPKGNYRETRMPIDDFGKNLFDDFTPEEWNAFLNVMGWCVQAWMEHGRIDPPMDNLLINTYRQKIGKDFMDWADTYFSEESGRLNTYWPRYKAYTGYTHEVKNSCSNRAFKEKLELWAMYHTYTLNPAACTGYRAEEKRITMKAIKDVWRDNRWQTPSPAEEESVEFFYIQTAGDEVKPAGWASADSPRGDGIPW